jgi:hypothetical protein
MVRWVEAKAGTLRQQLGSLLEEVRARFRSCPRLPKRRGGGARENILWCACADSPVCVRFPIRWRA